MIMIDKLNALTIRFPKWSCFIIGLIAAFAMPPFHIWPLLAFGLSMAVIIVSRQSNPWRGGWCAFYFGVGFFTMGLWWVANALMLDLTEYWWAIGFSILGLPVLLSLLWFVAGYVACRLARPHTLARGVLFLTLLCAAEYGRAFNLSGFPWNLFGYMWGNVPPLMQLASLGGAYFVTALTVLWMGLPALARLASFDAEHARKRVLVLAGVTLVTFIGGYTWGALRLVNHPTQMRTDVGVAIVQPNITPDEKWEVDKTLPHFMRHVNIAQQAIDTKNIKDGGFKTVLLVWPETSLEERLIMTVPEAPQALIKLMGNHPYQTRLVSGLWREVPAETPGRLPGYFNSIGVVSVTSDGKLNLDDLYDKHHLVPFGEYVPLEKTLGLTPLVGFAGFGWGSGPKVLRSDGMPPVSPMICFEAIFPWYGASQGAEWLVNTSNDGWYGNTAGPYQHLVMTQFRAIEQGKPVARSATTGISALIDPYGRVVQSLPYNRSGFIAGALPAYLRQGTLYTMFGEALFFLMLTVGAAVFIHLRMRKI